MLLSDGKSAIAIKADGIRIIAREGIKLVTRTDAQNSQGGTVDGIEGISLIAGGDDKYIEPLLSSSISKIKELGAEKTGLYLSGQTLPLLEKYLSFGFSQEGKIDFYEKEI